MPEIDIEAEENPQFSLRFFYVFLFGIGLYFAIKVGYI